MLDSHGQVSSICHSSCRTLSDASLRTDAGSVRCRMILRTMLPSGLSGICHSSCRTLSDRSPRIDAGSVRCRMILRTMPPSGLSGICHSSCRTLSDRSPRIDAGSVRCQMRKFALLCWACALLGWVCAGLACCMGKSWPHGRRIARGGQPGTGIWHGSRAEADPALVPQNFSKTGSLR